MMADVCENCAAEGMQTVVGPSGKMGSAVSTRRSSAGAHMAEMIAMLSKVWALLVT